MLPTQSNIAKPFECFLVLQVESNIAEPREFVASIQIERHVQTDSYPSLCIIEATPMSCDICSSTRKHRIDNDERESRNELVCLINNNEPTPRFVSLRARNV